MKMCSKEPKMIPKLIEATAKRAYQLHVKFEDCVEGNIDLSGWVGHGMFKVWNNAENFEKFHIDNLGKLVWSDEIDMDPDAFYLELIGKPFEEYARSQQVLRNHH